VNEDDFVLCNGGVSGVRRIVALEARCCKGGFAGVRKGGGGVR